MARGLPSPRRCRGCTISPSRPSGLSPTDPSASEPRASGRPPSGPALWLATAGGAGYLPVAPGTWGSLVALVPFPLLARLELAAYLALVAGLGAAGVWAAARGERAFGRKDDGRIVIDEVVGQLLTLAPLVWLREPLSAGAWLGVSPLLWLVVTGFVAFRVLDVWKPGPVRWAQERFAGGWGVMADDVLAGAIGALGMLPLALAALPFARAAGEAP